jgi:23S rRNA (uracil1939-C5)-methyltransferase
LAFLDGERIDVVGGIVGELVEVEISPVRRGTVTARIVRVLEPSPYRVSAPCSYFGTCTGCQWQHIDYQYQLKLKQQVVQQELDSIFGSGHIPVRETLPSAKMWNYRNHARFTVGRGGHLGFVNQYKHFFTKIESCMIMHPRINQILGQLQGCCSETTQLTVRTAVNGNDFLVQPNLKDSSILLETGQTYYHEQLRDYPFRVASPSFFQVNVPQAERMVELARSYLGLSGEELLVDAYAGVGTFAVLLSPYVRHVIAIEESSSAVRDAEINSQHIPNVTIRQGRLEDVFATLEQLPDIVVIDPPRVGCHPRFLAAIKRLQPNRIAYVSCDPKALARDLSILCDGTYRLEEVHPVDMFPHTYHVECLAILTLERASIQSEKGEDTIVLASSSPRRHDILKSMGFDFEVIHPDFQEPLPDGVSAHEYVRNLARSKADSVAQTQSTGLIIAADTVVVDGTNILRKPHRPVEAEAMLRQLRGKEHEVVTGVAVINTANGEIVSDVKSSQVNMRFYSDVELQRYVSAGGSVGKAGAYAIQDPVFHPVENINGCYLNIVGLSPCTLIDLMARVGVTFTPRANWQPPEACTLCPLRYSGVGS